jgi:hypothetical protein
MTIVITLLRLRREQHRYCDRAFFIGVGQTENDAVMERVDTEGNLLGFSILAVSQLAQSKPLIAELLPSHCSA